MAEARGTAQINDEISKWLDESFVYALLLPMSLINILRFGGIS
jgi:hypothetical protein